MSDTNFAFESRWDAGTQSRHTQVGCTCRMCHRTEWKNASGPGWGTRLFKRSGWLLGSNRHRDLCPGCRAQRPPSGRVLTPAQKRAAYLKIEGITPKSSKQHLITEASERTMLIADPSLLEPAKMAEALSHLGTVIVTKAPPFQPEPIRAAKTNRGTNVLATHGFAHRPAAHNSAKRWFEVNQSFDPVANYHYRVRQDDDGTWSWAVLPFDPAAPAPAPRKAFTVDRAVKTAGFSSEFYAERVARRFVRKLGQTPHRNGNYTVWHDPDKHAWAWRLVDKSAPAAEAPAPQPRAAWKDYVLKFGKRQRTRSRFGFKSSWSAMRAAWTQMHSDALQDPQAGVDFEVFADGDTWAWRPLTDAPDDVTPGREAAWVARAKHEGRVHKVKRDGFTVRDNARRAAFVALVRAGVSERPMEGTHYAITTGPTGYGWTQLLKTVQPKGAAAPPAPTETKMPSLPTETPMQPTAEAPPVKDRADIKAILDFIDIHYDADKERWRGDMSDAKAAEQLDKPRAWIAEERERAFGPNVSERDAQAAAKLANELVGEAEALVEQALKLAAAVELLKDKLGKALKYA